MAATPTQDGAQTRPPEARLADELRGGVDDLVRLGRMELELARMEAGSAAKRIGLGAGVIVAALMILYAGFVIVIGTLPAWLGTWWWWGVVGGVLWLLAGLIAFLGWRVINRARKEAMATVESIKGDVEWLRQLASRRSSAG